MTYMLMNMNGHVLKHGKHIYMLLNRINTLLLRNSVLPLLITHVLYRDFIYPRHTIDQKAIFRCKPEENMISLSEINRFEPEHDRIAFCHKFIHTYYENI